MQGSLFIDDRIGETSLRAFWHCFGVHAKESPAHIISRKRCEIEANNGWTLWSFNGKRTETIELWVSELRRSNSSHVYVLCSKSRNAVDPKGTSAFARSFKIAGEGDRTWQPIPDTIKVPHPFGSKSTASAFVVSHVFQPSDIELNPEVQWFCVGSKTWRLDNIPTRGEYLLRPGQGSKLRPISAILELKEPFVVQIRV